MHSRTINPLDSGLLIRVRVDGAHLVFRESRGREVRVRRPDARPLEGYSDEELEDVLLSGEGWEEVMRGVRE